MNLNLFNRKTREDRVLNRTQSVFSELVSDNEFEFTDLETVQILNNVRRKLSEHLKIKRAEQLEYSVNANQKAVEINVAIEFIE